MSLINGEFKQHIPVTDRGFQYGDGLFETIAVQQAQPLFLDLHLNRLQLGCQRLNIPCPDVQLLQAEARCLCKDVERAVLKIIVTRGSGGRGYRIPEFTQPTRVLSLHPYPDYSQSYFEQGVVLRFCQTRLGLNPGLAGLKHLNRLEQVLARSEWHDPDIQEGLMLDYNGFVIEGTMSNIFYFKNGCWITPSLTEAGVAGILRGLIMQLLHNHHIQVRQHPVTPEALLAADEILLCNSVVGIWPVRQCAQTGFTIGSNTRQLQQWLATLYTEQISHA